MRSLLPLLAGWMVHLARVLSAVGWRSAVMDELIKQAEEAAAAEQAAKEAAAKVTAKESERDLAIVNAEKSVNDAEAALQMAIDDRHTAQVYAIEQLSEANAALLAFVKGQQDTPAEVAA